MWSVKHIMLLRIALCTYYTIIATANVLENNKIADLKSKTAASRNEKETVLGKHMSLPPNYDRTVAPGENDTTLYYTNNQPRVIRVNQELMTVQVSLAEMIHWEDNRIQNDYSTTNDEIVFRFKSLRKLPIWTPLSYLDFRDVKIFTTNQFPPN